MRHAGWGTSEAQGAGAADKARKSEGRACWEINLVLKRGGGEGSSH